MMENNFPDSWELVKLVEQLNFLPTGVKEFEGIKKYFSTGSIQENEFTPEGEFTFINRPSRANRIAELGDVLQARMKATDKGLLIDEKLDGQLFSTGFLQVKPYGETYNNKLLYYYIKSEFFLTQKNELATGSTQEALTDNGANDIVIPLPPLPEQHRIVDKLDAVMQKVESNKLRLDKIPKLLKRFRQSVLAAAVSGRLTEEWRKKNNYENLFEISKQFEINDTYRELNELSENWKWVALGNYVKCNRGRFSIRPRNDPRYFGGSIPFIQIGDLPREGGFINTHKQTLNESGLKVSKMFPKNTLTMAIVGATIANTGILAYDMCFTDSMVGMNKGDLDLNLFLDYYLRIEKENFRQLSYAGGGQPNIKLELLNDYPFPLPPKEEQKEIVRKVEQLFAFADKIEARYTKAKTILDKLPQSILAKAFRGELVPQNPNDEPASVLLERIKKEKEKLAGEKKVKKIKEYSIKEKPLKIAAEKEVKYIKVITGK